jgi:hypothetical protein
LQIVSEYNRAEDGGNVNNFAGRASQLSVSHRSIRGAEIHGLRLDLFDTATRADRLIINENVWMLLAEFAQPLLVKRIGKCGARALQLDGSTRPVPLHPFEKMEATMSKKSGSCTNIRNSFFERGMGDLLLRVAFD